MDVSIFRDAKEMNPIYNLFKENEKRSLEKFILGDQTLITYDQHNEHFSIQESLTAGDRELVTTGYSCLYQYQNNRIQLEYQILNRTWIIISNDIDSKDEDEKLNLLLKNLKKYSINLSFDRQIQMIIKRFDQYFDELNEEKQSSKEEINDPMKSSNELPLETPFGKPSTIIEVDEEQIDSPIRSQFLDSDQKFNRLTPTIPLNRTRLDSSCSSTNSIKYTQFVPPSTKSVCRRRVIQSIHLLLQRKKKFSEKFFKKFHQNSPEPTLYQLGLEFLRLYDGKFNYPKGSTFVMLFQKKTYYLTIENFKCVECQLNEVEPRSVVILQYKDEYTTVQV